MNDASRSAIDIALEAFDRHWKEGRRPTAAAFLDQFQDDESEDFIELIYHEFCTHEQAGLNPSPDEFLRRYAGFAAPLEKLLALHVGLDSSGMGSEALLDATSNLPRVGDAIGVYQLVEILGRGISGIVYKALQTDLGNRPVVLKVSVQGPVSDALFQAKLTHPNIIPVFRHFSTEDGSLHVMVSPFLEGRTLLEILQQAKNGQAERNSPQFEPELRKLLPAAQKTPLSAEPGQKKNRRTDRDHWRVWVATVAEALSEALYAGFQAGVIHGDIKPANIFVDCAGKPYLIDFHLAREWQHQRHRRLVTKTDPGGTLYYMPPERLKNFSATLDTERAVREKDAAENANKLHLAEELHQAGALHRADLYSLGIVLVELLTGTATAELSPDETESISATAASLGLIRSDRNWFRCNRAFRQLPERWQDVLAALLDPEPSGRPIDGNELARQFRRVREWEEGRISRRKKRRQQLLTRILPIALVMLAGVAFVGWEIQSARRDSSARVARLWSEPGLLAIDPAESDEKSESVRLRDARVQFDRAIESNSHLWRPSLWRFVCMNSNDRLDAEFWVADRVERLSEKLAQRAKNSVTDDDRTNLMRILNYGLAQFEVAIWRNRVGELGELHRAEHRLTHLEKRDGRRSPEIDAFVSQILIESEPTDQDAGPWDGFNRQFPQSFACMWSAGRFQANRGQFSEAVASLNGALKLNPNHFESLRLLAYCEFQQKTFGESLKQLEFALRIRNDDLSALRLRTILRIYSGQRAELITEIQRLEELLTFQKSGSSTLSGMDLMSESFEMSDLTSGQNRDLFNRKTIETLMKLIPGDQQIMTLQAHRHFLDRNYQEATTVLESMRKKGPLTTGDALNLATLYATQRQDARARDLVFEVLERPDLNSLFQSQKTVRNLIFSVLLNYENQDPPAAQAQYEKVAKHCQKQGIDLGRCHYRMARCLVINNDNPDLDQVERLLIQAGQQHMSYLNKMYVSDHAFDPVRESINPTLFAVFPSLNSIAETAVSEQD